MPTVITGVRDTNHNNTETRLVRDVSDMLARLEPDEAPLTSILGQIGKEQATDPKIEWFEDELLPRFDKLAASLSASATTMTVTNYAYFRAGDLVKVANKEIVRVTTTPTSTAVSIKRATGETGGTEASSGDQLWIYSNSNQEGASSRNLASTQKSPVFNYCQIFREPFGFTRTQLLTKTFAGKDKDNERFNSMVKHKRDIEQALFFGQRYIDTSGTHPERQTRGITTFITTNVKDVANLTEQEFEDFLRLAFRYGSREKILFCSPKLITVLNGYARSKMETVGPSESYGVTMTRYQNAGRKLKLVEHVLFTNDSLNDLSGIAGYGVLVDVKNIKLKHMGNRLSELNENIQANDVDGEQHEYISEVGLELRQERMHALLTGVLG